MVDVAKSLANMGCETRDGVQAEPAADNTPHVSLHVPFSMALACGCTSGWWGVELEAADMGMAAPLPPCHGQWWMLLAPPIPPRAPLAALSGDPVVMM